MPVIENHVDDFLRSKLKDKIPVLSMFIGEKTITSLKEVFMQEIETIFPEVMKQFAGNLKNELDLEEIVIKKVAGFSSDKLEEILHFHHSILLRETRFGSRRWNWRYH